MRRLASTALVLALAVGAATLVLRGDGDQAIARERSRALVDAIPGAQWVEIPHAGHTCTLEQPDAVTRALTTFLDSTAGPSLR